MALDISTQTIEIERVQGTKSIQILTRAEAQVTGAGREAVEVLLTEAEVIISSAQAQEGRVMIEATLFCQGVYRQGDETILRALTASAPVSQAVEIPGTQPGMRAQACANVEHIDARYENGRMVFFVTTSITAQAVSLSPQDVIVELSGDGNIETSYSALCSVKTAAVTSSSSIIRGEVNLPAALDARTTLLDRAVATVDSAQADLGGVRVKGQVNVEALVSSGVEGRPAAMVRYAMDFDQLMDVPEWLAKDVCAAAAVKRLATRVDQSEGDGDARLAIEAELEITVSSIAQDCVRALSDAYATTGKTLVISGELTGFCPDISCTSCTNQAKGTILLSENAPAPGNIIAVTARPNISGFATDGESAIEGVIEASVLYVPGGGGPVAVSTGEMPFSVPCPGSLNDTSLVCVKVVSADASAIMSDRVELRVTLQVETSTHARAEISLVTGVEEGADICRTPGIVLYWPDETDDAWSVARRYSIPVSTLENTSAIEKGKAVVLKI